MLFFLDCDFQKIHIKVFFHNIRNKFCYVRKHYAGNTFIYHAAPEKTTRNLSLKVHLQLDSNKGVQDQRRANDFNKPNDFDRSKSFNEQTLCTNLNKNGRLKFFFSKYKKRNANRSTKIMHAV